MKEDQAWSILCSMRTRGNYFASILDFPTLGPVLEPAELRKGSNGGCPTEFHMLLERAG